MALSSVRDGLMSNSVCIVHWALMKPDPLLEYTRRYGALDWLAPLTVFGWRYGAVKLAWQLVSIWIAIRVT